MHFFVNSKALSCKLGNEFAAYYKALEENPHDKDR